MTNYLPAFHRQKARAKARGIGWELTFSQWLAIWGNRTAERGRGSAQLCMARFGDTGPYSVGNVKIVTNAENRREQRFMESHRSALAEKVRMRWADTAHRAKMIAIHRAPERRAEYSRRMTEQMADPARRQKVSDAVKRRMADPVKREKQAECVRSYWARYRAAKAAGATA
jgi:hypothetical protein